MLSSAGLVQGIASPTQVGRLEPDPRLVWGYGEDGLTRQPIRHLHIAEPPPLGPLHGHVRDLPARVTRRVRRRRRREG